MPISVLLDTSNPVRQRLSRWKVCLTTGPSLLCHPSLTGGVVSRRVRPLPVFSLRQPMQALYYAGGAVTGNEKTHKAWLSVCRHVPRRVRTKAYGLGFCLRRHSDAHSVWQKKILCNRLLELVCERPQLPVDFSTRTVSQQTHSVCLAADLHQHG